MGGRGQRERREEEREKINKRREKEEWKDMSCGTCLEISRPEFGSDSAMYYMCDFSQVFFLSLGLFLYPFQVKRLE